MRLSFAGGATPKLIQTQFHGAEPSEITWNCDDQFDRPAVHAFAALVISKALGEEALVDPRALKLLSNAVHDARRPELMWPLHMFGDRALLPALTRLEYVRQGKGDRRPRAATLGPALPLAQISLELDEKPLAGGARRLRRLQSELLQRIRHPAVAMPSDHAPGTLADALRASVGASAASVAISIAEMNKLVPWMAARRLMRIILAHTGDTLTICLSGGRLQQHVIAALKQLVLERTRRPIVVRLVAANRMRHDSDRASCSAELLAFELATVLAPVVTRTEIVLPPTWGIASDQAAYRDIVESADVMLLAGGSPQSSFISQYLARHGTRLPHDAVGDLAGNPIGSRGADVTDDALRRILERLGCLPTLEQLRAIVARGRARVMLIADSLPGDEGPPAAKGRVVRAALLGGLANDVVVSRELADIVAGEPATAWD